MHSPDRTLPIEMTQRQTPIGRRATGDVRRRKSLRALGAICSALLTTSSHAANTLVVEAPPRSPAEQLEAFHLPPGFTIQLVAAEPVVKKPINLAFDDAGRLYATGSIEYPFAATDPAKARDVVTRLEIGSNGAITHRAVVDRLNIPIGIASLGDELLVYGIPELLRCRDGDGEGMFEVREPLVRGFGFRDTHGMVNGLAPWIDGWVYSCHGFSNESKAEGTDGSQLTMQSGNTFRWRHDGSHVEQYTHGQVNPFGLAFDEWGHLFSADCHTLPAYQLLRGAWYPSFGKPHDGLGYGPSIMSHAHGSTGIAGIVYYDAEQFPPDYRRTLFIGNPITGRINHDRLERAGASYRAVEQPDFLTCDDPWFRPVDLKLGPDGALYVADFYNCIIGHYEVPLDHPQRDRERGRIWRISYTGKGANQARVVMPNLRDAPVSQLVEHLGDANITLRTQAVTRLTMRRLSSTELAELRAIAMDSGAPPLQRVGAMWVVERSQPNLLEKIAIRRLVADSNPLVRTHAATVLGERSNDRFDREDGETLRIALKDNEAFVALAAAEALAKHPSDTGIPELLEVRQGVPAGDVQLAHALKITLRQQLALPKALTSLEESAIASHRGQIADICLGIPSQDAASFLLQKILSNATPEQRFDGRFVEHVARHLNKAQLPDLYAVGGEIKDTELRLVFYRSLGNGLSARKVPIPDAAQQAMNSIVRTFLADKDEALQKRGLDLAKELRRPELFGDVRPLTAKSRGVPALRTAAYEALAACDPAQATPILVALLNNVAEPTHLQSRAVQLLSGFNTTSAREALSARGVTASDRLAAEIAAGLAVSKEGAELLLTAVAAGKMSARVLQEPPVQLWFSRSQPQDFVARVAVLTKGLPPADDRLKKLIAARVAAFGKTTPDSVRGEAHFQKTCAACHRIGERGNKIGPQLDGVGRRGLERLLEDILDPNRTVDQAFRATQFTLVDGRILTGLVVRREGDVVVVADSQGKEQRLSNDDIEAQSVLPLSPMPANVGETLSERECLELAAFLMKQEQPMIMDNAK
ncbi:MAG: dehydrogenase [Pirellula sp.]|nr:dehydrogenase [Pirellula sp.]